MAMAALARGDGGEFGSEVECLRKVFVIWVQRSDQGWKLQDHPTKKQRAKQNKKLCCVCDLTDFRETVGMKLGW